MAYSLEFVAPAKKEWDKLSSSLKAQFKKKLKERLENPHVESAKLRGELASAYKIKLQSAGYRLVYVVEDDVLVVLVLSVGKRDKQKVYERAIQTLKRAEKS